MEYTVKKLAEFAGVSVRTLHYYDEIGLLQPSHVKQNGYRYYSQKELLKLQQILFFKELEFSLDQITKMVNAPDFDVDEALDDQKKLLRLKKERIDELLKTLDLTIKKIKDGENMNTNKIYKGFSQDQIDEYKVEVSKKWGNTEAYKQSEERTKHWTSQDYKKTEEESRILTKELGKAMDKGIADPEVQSLIARHHKFIEQFYDCDLEMYKGLGEMYVSDKRFAKTYNSVRPGLAEFVRDAILYYCKNK